MAPRRRTGPTPQTERNEEDEHTSGQRLGFDTVLGNVRPSPLTDPGFLRDSAEHDMYEK
jgi:hypothetical protein